MFSLSGKTALVTGATGGIGEAVAKALAQAGAKIAISGTRREKLEEVANALGGAIILPCNLKDSAAVDALVPSAEAQLGQLDILVCNAGITKDGLAMRMKDEDFEEVIDVNLVSSFKLCRSAIKGMIKRRSGRIITISSVVAVMGNPGQANYCASKAGLIGMGKSLAAEVAGRNITVNSIAPGFIKTPMTEKLNEEQQSRITANIPAARFGLPEDIGGATVFLASDQASYITGQTIHINGGLLMV